MPNPGRGPCMICADGHGWLQVDGAYGPYGDHIYLANFEDATTRAVFLTAERKFLHRVESLAEFLTKQQKSSRRVTRHQRREFQKATYVHLPWDRTYQQRDTSLDGPAYFRSHYLIMRGEMIVGMVAEYEGNTITFDSCDIDEVLEDYELLPEKPKFPYPGDN